MSIETYEQLVVTYFSSYFGDQPIRNMLVVMLQEFIFFLYLRMLYSNLKKMEHYIEEEKQQKLLSVATKSLSERLPLMEENVKQTRRDSHDGRHFNHLLLELMNTGETEEAIEILQKQDNKKSEQVKSYCEYPLHNAVISFYMEKAAKEGIETGVQLDILHLRPMDFQHMF